MKKDGKSYVRLLHTSIDRTVPSRLAILVVAIYIMTLGVALSIQANLGSSPISVMPLAWSASGGTMVSSFRVPEWSMVYVGLVVRLLYPFSSMVERMIYHT